MNGRERRDELLRRVRTEENPVTGTDLAQALGVSRQIIVQDVAVLRAAGEDIISTPRGYMLAWRPANGSASHSCHAARPPRCGG